MPKAPDWSEFSDGRVTDELKTRAGTDPGYAIAFALMRLASAQERTAMWLKHLGLADAATPMGALEIVAMEIKAAAAAQGEIAAALDRIADAMPGGE